MVRKTPLEILHGLIGPPAEGVEVLGPNECRLLDALTARVRGGLIDFSITWGTKARSMTREELAAVAIEALSAPARESARKIFEFDGRRRPGISVDEFLATV